MCAVYIQRARHRYRIQGWRRARKEMDRVIFSYACVCTSAFPSRTFVISSDRGTLPIPDRYELLSLFRWTDERGRRVCVFVVVRGGGNEISSSPTKLYSARKSRIPPPPPPPPPGDELVTCPHAPRLLYTCHPLMESFFARPSPRAAHVSFNTRDV